MNIPQSFIEDLLSRVSIMEIVGAQVKLKKAGRHYLGCCPFHHEKTASFCVTPDKQFYYCFGCGASGSALSFLIEYHKLSFIEAVKQLASQVGVDLPEDGSQVTGPDPELYKNLELAAKFYQQQLRLNQNAINYLKQRGITGKTALQFGLGYAPNSWQGLKNFFSTTSQLKSAELDQQLIQVGLWAVGEKGGHDYFKDRIMFPIRDARGRVLGFGGRSLGDKLPKYLNSPDTELFHKGQMLYGLYEALQHSKNFRQLVLVEGYLDVITLHQAGINNAVATLGTATSKRHLQILYRYTDTVVLAFDGDEAGRQAAKRAVDLALGLMTEGRSLQLLFLPQGQDPDSFVRAHGPSAWEKLLQHTSSLPEYLLQQAKAAVDFNTMEGRAKLVGLLRPILEKIPAGSYQDIFAARIAEISGLSVEKIIGGPSKPEAENFSSEPKISNPKRFSWGTCLSLEERALSLLIQNPELVWMLDATAGLQICQKEYEQIGLLLCQLIREQQIHSTKALLDLWPDRATKPLIGKLASYPHPLDKDKISMEFSEILQNMGSKAARDLELAALRAKVAELGWLGLAEAEKQRLKDLLAANT